MNTAAEINGMTWAASLGIWIFIISILVWAFGSWFVDRLRDMRHRDRETRTIGAWRPSQPTGLRGDYEQMGHDLSRRMKPDARDDRLRNLRFKGVPFDWERDGD